MDINFNRESLLLGGDFHNVGQRRDPFNELLYTCYHLNFHLFPLSKRADLFLEIKSIIFEIEEILEKNESIEFRDEIRKRVRNLLMDADCEKGFIEIGLILFYLRFTVFPADFFEEESPIFFLAKKIVNHIDFLIDQQRACGNYLVPSGKTAYLVHTFCCLVMTSNQELSRAGVMAIQQFLNSPIFGISKYLEWEHRERILTVCQNILDNPSWSLLFRKELKIHPDLEDLVRLDLKLDLDKKVMSQHIFYACLMSLFTDFRQVGSNCYAVAALIYSIENKPFQVVLKMAEWLEQGTLNLDSDYSIPLLPLVEKRLVHVSNLKIRMCANLFFISKPFKQIKHVLKINEVDHSGEPASINRILKNCLLLNNASEHLFYAKKIFSSYKRNALIELHLAVSEFMVLNFNHSFSRSFTASSLKTPFLNACVTAIEENLEKPFPRFYYFRNVFLEKLSRSLWHENFADEIKVKDSQLKVGSRKISYEGDLRVLKKYLDDSRGVFYLQDKKIQQLDTISQLQEVLVYEGKKTLEDLSKSHSCLYSKNAFLIINAIRSSGFRAHFSNFSVRNLRGKITTEHLNQADVLFLNGVAASALFPLKHTYHLNYSLHDIGEIQTPYQFLKSFFCKLKDLDLESMKKSPRIILRSNNHFWTLNPKTLIEKRENFRLFVQKKIFNPAKSYLNRLIPTEMISIIFARYLYEKNKEKKLTEIFSSDATPTYKEFRDRLLRLAKSKQTLTKILEEEFSKIKLTKQDLTKVLNALQVKVDGEIFSKIFRSLSWGWTFPYHLARQLSLSLIEEKIHVFSPCDVELAISEALNLPQSILIGDSNWFDDYTEDPYHIHYTIKYSWALETLAFFVRRANGEVLDTDQNIKGSFIICPK